MVRPDGSTDYRNDMTREAVTARRNATAAGQFMGTLLLVEARELVDKAEGVGPDFDPYLEYLMYLSAGQALINEGRRIGGIDFRKADNELEGKRR